MPKIVDRESRRQHFIEAAYQTILAEGVAKTTIRSVAKRAGYTTGALVHYFKDKDDLIGQVLEENGKLVRSAMEAAAREYQGRAALRRVIDEALPKNTTQGASWRIWLALWYHSEESADMRREQELRYQEWTGRLRDILQQSVEMAELSEGLDLKREAESLVALIDGIGVQYLMTKGRMSPRHIDDIIETYLDRLYAS